MFLKYFTLATLVAIVSGQAFALNEGLRYHLKSMEHGKAAAYRFDGSLRLTQDGFFQQKLSHDDPGSASFGQRYFIDSKYATAGETAPVFYIICGEWNCDGTGSYSSVERLAKEVGAHLVALEHRYYGESLPFRKLTTERLSHLNLDAAITDLAVFQKHAMETLNLKGKWVAFGGSYAGTLAAFYRLKHPELVTGALASSAPVLVKAEFNEYDAHVASVINKTACGDMVREAVAGIESRMATREGTLAVKALFNSSDVVNDDDFLYVVADMLAAAVQYGRHTKFCNDLAAHADRVAGYARAGINVLSSMGTTPIEISMQAAEVQDITPASYFRQWMWQSCLEFGWFQVANGSGTDTSRSSRIDLPYHDRVCERLYGQGTTADGSLNANWYAPLFSPSTSNIIFTNGSNDPWLRLSVIPGVQAPNLDLLMIDGAAHCNDLNALSALPTVQAAQVRFGEIIKGWLL
jgi:pimeloyl-ACP methyl ester carboxylesterase